jgi:hypothetical protein
MGGGVATSAGLMGDGGRVATGGSFFRPSIQHGAATNTRIKSHAVQ